MSKDKRDDKRPGVGATQFANAGLYQSGMMPSERRSTPRTSAERAAAERVASMARAAGGSILSRAFSKPRQQIVTPTTFGPDTRTMQARLAGLKAAADAPQDVGYTVDDVAAVISQYAGSPSGGGGGGGGRGGGGGGGVAGPSKKDIDAMIQAMREAATASQTEIGNIYGAADKTLAELTAQYAAAQQALGAGAERTMSAFGVPGQQMAPTGMTAGDYLTASRGTLSGLSAAQQARLAAQKAAYELIAADILKQQVGG